VYFIHIATFCTQKNSFLTDCQYKVGPTWNFISTKYSVVHAKQFNTIQLYMQKNFISERLSIQVKSQTKGNENKSAHLHTHVNTEDFLHFYTTYKTNPNDQT